MKTREQKSVQDLIASLRNEKILTWFDLGLFLDRLRDKKSNCGFEGEFFQFKEKLVKGGMGFLSFYYAIDGITIEVAKYIEAIRRLFPGIPIHLISGSIKPETRNVIDYEYHPHVIEEITSFDDWALYDDFFKIKLQRGSKEYNALITKFWEETLVLTEKLAQCVIENNISLLFTVNICSNPGNVSLALATVLVAEYLGIPVMNNNHDFYWEGGNKKVDIEEKNLEPGPRDFFFTNADVGEFFSPIEMLYPWESRSWMTVDINRSQVHNIIGKKGHNPANVAWLGTTVDITKFDPVSKRESLTTLGQIGAILNNKVHSIKKVREEVEYFKKAPFLSGFSDQENFDFINNNIFFFQPTRILWRKCIEVNFDLVAGLFSNRNFIQKFVENPLLNLSLIISGPIPVGQEKYFESVLQKFEELLNKLPEKFREKVYLGCLFSTFDKEEFKKENKRPIKIPDLYNAATLVLLPSFNEGRGLPIIEAAAAGKPIFCRRYHPEEVYAEVIGEHLDESLRLRVLEFRQTISKKLIDKTVNRIFYPQEAMNDDSHNVKVINKRFNLDSLQKNLDDIFYKFYLQLQSINNRNKKTSKYFEEYDQFVNFENSDLKALINTDTREYLPGYGRLGFMIYLKSLIDPSFFRVEEQFMRGEIYLYAQSLVRENKEGTAISVEKYHHFFNTVAQVLLHHENEIEIQHDHSLAYRHRNKKYYPYRKYTYHELTGLINIIFNDIINPQPQKPKKVPSRFFFTDWNLALVQLTNSKRLGIDDRPKLFEKMKQKIPRIYFPGKYLKYELEFFILQPIRAILKLNIEEELTTEILKENIEDLPDVFIFVHEYHMFNRHSPESIKSYLESTLDRELNRLYRLNIVKIVKVPQYCIGFHLHQMGEEGLKILRQVKEQKGFIITNGQSAALMTDILDIDRFHIGKVKRTLTARIMGIPLDSGFIQFVPAGVRTSLAYPTPIQTSKDFEKAIKSRRFKKLVSKIGEGKLFTLLKEDAETNGTPINLFLKNLEYSLTHKKKKSGINFSYVGGVYKDGMPWNGVLAKIEVLKKSWSFCIHTAMGQPKPVPDLIEEHLQKSGKQAGIGWNGGYILNPELVGKLGLPATYIGSPLGLLIMEKEVVCPPLFNKPALLVYDDGRLAIERVNSNCGFLVSNSDNTLKFAAEYHNIYSDNEPCYYDLFFEEDEIMGNGNVLVRLAGNVVKEIIHTNANEKVKIIPVGLTLSIPRNKFSPEIFELNKALQITLLSSDGIKWENIKHAVEAGPMLVSDGKACIDMLRGGWKTQSSIKTQAARLDYTDMRGPKIAVGLTDSGTLLVLAVNGRIRESVGATHHDMAEILISYGAKEAMGFDPGGSSTLVVGGKVLNISPYNSQYERDNYSLPPEPRFVSNAVLGWQD